MALSNLLMPKAARAFAHGGPHGLMGVLSTVVRYACAVLGGGAGGAATTGR